MSDKYPAVPPGNDETPEETLKRLQDKSSSPPVNSDASVTPPPVGEPAPPPESSVTPPPAGWGKVPQPLNPYDISPSTSGGDSNYAPLPPPQGYGAPIQQGVGAHPQTVTILVLGIVGVLCCQILGPVAWYMGHVARQETSRSNGAYNQNNTTLNIGWVLGIVATVLFGLSILLFATGVTGNLIVKP